jgi:hypothetical protein
MQTQTKAQTQLEQHWKVKTQMESDYEYIVNNNQDRLGFMEDLMQNEVVDKLTKTSKSYNKKSELVCIKFILIFVFREA